MAQQSSALQGPMRIFIGRLTGQASLNAGVEATVTISWRNPLPRNFDTGTMGVWAQVYAQAEANVQYVAQIDNTNSASTTSLQVKVKNVGSANGTQPWNVYLMALDQGDLLS